MNGPAIGYHPTIVGFGGKFPEQEVNNVALAEMLGSEVDPDRIAVLSGVHTRYWMDEGEQLSDLARIAAERALFMSGADPNELAEHLVSLHLATITPDSPSPNMASVVHGKLSAPASCVPVPLAADCSGFPLGLRLACQELSTSNLQRPEDRALVIGAQALSKFLNKDDLAMAGLWGDGAGAVILKRMSGAFRPAFDIITYSSEVEQRAMGVRGTDHPRIIVDSRAAPHPIVEVMTESANRVAHATGLWDQHQGAIDWRHIDYFVPHQTHPSIISAVAENLGVPEEKRIITVDKHGNTSSATIPLALWEASQQGKFEPGRRYRLLIDAAGAGIMGGSGLIDMVLPEQPGTAHYA